MPTICTIEGGCYNPARGAQRVQWLKSGAKRLGLALTPYQEEQFCRYRHELLDWNSRVNLTSITEPADIERLHFLDSLTLALALPEPLRAGYQICDVGSGAGFPGVPVKILFPDIRLTLIDSTAKRTRFLNALVNALGLEGVNVHTGRSEELGHDATLREAFDMVVSRGVAALRVLAEYTLPFCRVGGQVVLQKKGDVKQELAEATHAWDELGGGLIDVRPVPPDVLEGERVLVVVEKVAPTPDKYPRRAGVPAKRPL